MFYSKQGKHVTKEVIDLVYKKESLLEELENIQKKIDELL